MSAGRPHSWSFILVAAGSGSRMGGTPKQFRSLGGRPLWRWSAAVAEELYACGKIDELLVVFPQDYVQSEAAGGMRCPAQFVVGGATRSESVTRGLAAATSDFVLIHDAARPFLPPATCLALMARTEADCGAVPLLGSTDSLKHIAPDGVMSALPREDVYRTQTPQAFPRTALLDVLRGAPDGATDEATLWLGASRRMASVPGDERNFKITTAFDWLVAKSLVSEARETRVGFGYDVHELVPHRDLVLGGVKLSSPLGLLGHSDADVVCHAVSDALLGAACLGDIGTRYPATDERYRGADSTLLLQDVLHLLTEEGWTATGLDVTLVAQVPRLAAQMPKISDNLRKLFTASCHCVKLNVKVKSGECVGSVGRAECMVCYVSASIERYGDEV